MRLSRLSAMQLPDSVERPRYLRGPPDHTIVHFGIGAFHRAHQAVYTDDANARGEAIWGIAGVSLRSPAVAAQLNPQDGLYTSAFRSASGTRRRLVASVREVLVAPAAEQQILAALAAANTRIASFTISEKGYCRDAAGNLDPNLAGDLSIYRFLAEGLALRRQSGLPGLTLLSCDNLSRNGEQLHTLLTQYLEQHAPALTRWFHDECTCPATMVDRIVPASTEADLHEQAAALCQRDEGAVFTEEFTQWVIEDRFAGPRPQWEAGGAQFTRNVQAFETAKLRMLNGAHSALAYLGLARGHQFVHEAIADPFLQSLVLRLMREEAATSFTPAAEQDIHGYADILLQRFANPMLRHQLRQISMDGSQKIPQRWLDTLAFHQRAGHSCPAILSALAAWITFIRGDRWQVDDPEATRLAALWQNGDAAEVVDALFGPHGMFCSHWVASRADRATLLARIRDP
jgi:fructuronate reductase